MAQHYDSDEFGVERASGRRTIRSMWALCLAFSVVPVALLSLMQQSNSALDAAHIVSVAVTLLLVIVYAVFLPTRRVSTPVAPRVAAIVCGVVSVIVAWSGEQYGSFLPALKFGEQGVSVPTPVAVWLMATALGLALLLILGFVMQMSRGRRTRLIDSLSVTVSSGALGWCGGAWVLWPELLAGRSYYLIAILLVVFAVSFALYLALPWGKKVPDSPMAGEQASHTFVREDDWRTALSVGTIPVLLTGITVPLMLLVAIFIR